MKKVDYSLNTNMKQAYKHEIVEHSSRNSVARVMDADEAVFIALACNTHAQLIDALKAGREALNNVGRGDILGAFEKINKALAAAGAA